MDNWLKHQKDLKHQDFDKTLWFLHIFCIYW